MSRKNVLVILPIDRDKTALKELSTEDNCLVNIHYLEEISFKYDAICTEFDVKNYVNRAMEYVTIHRIDGVIYSHDMASLVAALICEKAGLPGPSLDSVFLACHKYYSRQKDASGLACQAVNIHQYNLKEIGMTYPCYVKAPSLMCSHLHFVANNEEEMKEILVIMRRELSLWGKMFFDFFKLFISKEKYPLAHEEIVLVEELVVDYSQCAVEGWVDAKGRVHIWAISDINYHKNKQRSQNCYSMPTSASAAVQAQIIATTTQAIINHGITNGFFNVDIWHWEGKRPCKIIEVNGRAASLYQLMHKKCFNANLYKAMLFLCLGQDFNCYLESPIVKTFDKQNAAVGALFFVVTFGKGLASKFIDFENVKKMMGNDEIYGMELFVQPESEIRDNGTAGFRMAKFYVFGSSYRDINNIANYWRSSIIKDISLSPYNFKVKSESPA